MAGDGSLGGEQITMRGAMGSDILTGSNWTPMSSQISTQIHVNTPRNLGTIPKGTKDKDVQLLPPVQDQPNKQGALHNLDRYAYKSKLPAAGYQPFLPGTFSGRA